MKLIKLSKYILKLEPLGIGGVKKYFDWFEKVRSYTEFLNTELSLGMFIPTDKEGNVLGKPEEHLTNRILYYKELKQYQEAKERVIFEGFEMIEISKGLRIIKNVEKDCQVFANQFENHYYLCNEFEIIENLTPYNLTLTTAFTNKYK